MISALVIAVLLQTPYLCTEAEIAAYERQGWDAYECHGDKAAWLETPED